MVARKVLGSAALAAAVAASRSVAKVRKRSSSRARTIASATSSGDAVVAGSDGNGGSLPVPLLAELGLGGAGHHEMRVHAGAGEVEVQRFGEQLERALRRRVRAGAERDHVRAHRRHAHDVAAPALDHAGEQREREPHGTEVVDRHHALDVGGRERRGLPPLGHAHVVHQHVDAAELVDGSCARARRPRRDPRGRSPTSGSRARAHDSGPTRRPGGLRGGRRCRRSRRCGRTPARWPRRCPTTSR